MIYGIETAVLVFIELGLYYLRTVAETTLNRYAAVGQMAIESGYQYGLTVEVIQNVWLALALIAATIYALTIYIQTKKENEK